MRCALVLCCALPLLGQESKFGVNSRLVLVPVTVTDVKGHSIDGLEADAFTVLDAGKAQKITVDTIATGVAPIALAIAIQSSGISIPILEKVRKVGSLIQPLVTGERGCASLVTFAETVNWLQECTNDGDAIIRAFRQVQSGEYKRAVMLEAVQSAIERLQRQPNSRRVLLLISESKDRGSKQTLQEVTVAAESANVTVYAATYSLAKAAFTSKAQVGPPPPAPKPKSPSEAMGTPTGAPSSKYNPKGIPKEQRADLGSGLGELLRLHKENATQALSTLTGGTTFPFARQKGLEEAISKLGTDLHSQYILSFAPDDSEPGYHKLEVRVAQGQYQVRARPGYWVSSQ